MCLGAPGQIIAIVDAERALALIDVGGEKRQVNISCIIDEDNPVQACVGQWVLAHSGFAMERLDEAEAKATLALLLEMQADGAQRLQSLEGRD